MYIASNSEKRNRIIGLEYVLLSDATVRDYPGNFIQVLTSDWNPLPFTSISFNESDSTNGEYINQEIAIVLTGTNSEVEKTLLDISGRELLIRLKYGSGMEKVVGTEENPVILAVGSAGSPVQHTLETKRNSAEKSKALMI